MLQRFEIKIDSPFRFETGGVLNDMTLVYHSPARERRQGEKVIWICHALTGNSNPEEWWPEMVGEGRLIDTEKYFVVCASMLCSSYGKCGPASLNPATGKPWLLDFPEMTIRDIVNANILIRKHLGIDRIDLMIGPSIGGFQTVEWLVMEPEVISRAALIATDSRATPYLTAFNESQRMALLADPSFKEAKDISGGSLGLRCARSIALISYRSFKGYQVSQEERDDDTLFADRAASYQRYQGEKIVSRGFDAYSYWYLTHSLDSMNLGRGRGGVNKALKSIKAECTVIGIDSDQLFPTSQLKEMAKILDAEYCEINSLFGHDGFLIEHDQLEVILKPLIDK